MAVDQISVAKAILWEQTKGNLRALASVSGAHSSSEKRSPDWEEVSKRVETLGSMLRHRQVSSAAVRAACRRRWHVLPAREVGARCYLTCVRRAAVFSALFRRGESDLWATLG